MRITFVIFCFVFGVISGMTDASVCFESSLTDICSSNTPLVPKLLSRGPTTLISNETSHWTFCDVYAIDTQKWYRSSSPMTTSCPPMYMCGTKFPIWLNGMHPTPENGLVNRTSCLKDFDTCCLLQYRLAVVNCTEFTAYCFVDLPSSCHQRYCFDVNESVSTARMHTASDLTTASMDLDTDRSTNADLNVNESVSTARMHTASDLTTASMDLDTDHSTNADLKVVDENEKFIQVFMACLGLMVVVIVGMVIVIIRSKRKAKIVDEKVPEKADPHGDKSYESLGVHNDNYIKDIGSVYRVLSYEHFNITGGQKDSSCQTRSQPLKF